MLIVPSDAAMERHAEIGLESGEDQRFFDPDGFCVVFFNFRYFGL